MSREIINVDEYRIEIDLTKPPDVIDLTLPEAPKLSEDLEMVDKERTCHSSKYMLALSSTDEDQDYENSSSGQEFSDHASGLLPMHMDNMPLDEIEAPCHQQTLIRQLPEISQTISVSTRPYLPSLLGHYGWSNLGAKSIFQKYRTLKSKSSWYSGFSLPYMCMKPVETSYIGMVSHAPGSVMKIVQAMNKVIISSAVQGGGPDYENEQIDPYNGPGTLLVLDNKKFAEIDGHSQIKQDSESGHSFTKHYTINDMAVDPTCPYVIVTSGNDKKIIVWNIIHDEPSLQCHARISLDHVPISVAFSGNGSNLGVGCQNGTVNVYPQIMISRHMYKFYVAPLGKENHATGAIAWGLDSTQEYLFASSEPRSHEEPGFHQAFDVKAQRLVYTFDASESGDALAMHPTGDQLALITQAANGLHILRLYDIRQRRKKAIAEINMASMIPCKVTGSLGEVNCATFSSDGIYLALARSDNATQVYDGRMLNHGVLHVLHHGPQEWNSGQITFGAVHAEWVNLHSGSQQLATGGEDGCVRLWDIDKSCEDAQKGCVISQSQNSVSYFKFGEACSDAHSLIVGDNAGHISVYNIPGGLAAKKTANIL